MITKSMLQEYCLDVILDDRNLIEREDMIKVSRLILREWSEEELKSYAVCESIETMGMNSLLEHDAISLSDKFDLDKSLQREVIISEGVGKTILGILFWGVGPWAIWRVIKNNFNKHTKKCRMFGLGKSYDKCMLDAKIKYTQDQINLVKKNMSDKGCDEKCKAQSTVALQKLKLKLAKYQLKFRQYKHTVD